MKWMFFVLASIFLLTACASTLQPSIVAQSIQENATLDLCEKLECGAGKTCIEGACACKEEFKQCSTACIPQSNCCTNTDCEEKHACTNGKCVIVPWTCEFNEQFSMDTKNCVCVPGTKRCNAQEKCIPERSCCIDSDCSDRDNKCSPTTFAATICLRDPSAHCKSIPEGAQEIFALERGAVKIMLSNITEKSSAELVADNTPFNTTLNNPANIAGKKITVTGIKVFGGTCKDK
ncbi:MAG: hypothetical protein HY363_02835 [Candidatus Aenigmarchaeota archaeon]|nr:hypothetical protein [Candidatus Aenigmarchaeota archaeon]